MPSLVDAQPSELTTETITALQLGPRKKPYRPSLTFRSLLYKKFSLTFSRTNDPLVHYGRHFGRVVHAMCNVQALITNGLLLMSDDVPEESLPTQYVILYVPSW